MTCDTLPLDSLCVIRQVCTDTIHRINYDSLTVAMVEKSQSFYSGSFDRILIWLGIIIAVICVSIGIPSFLNWLEYKKSKKYIEKEYKKIKEYTNKIGKHFLFFFVKDIHMNNDDLIKANAIKMFFMTIKEFELDIESTKGEINEIKNIIIDDKFGSKLETNNKTHLIYYTLRFEDFCYAKNKYKNEIYQLISALETKFGKKLIDDVKKVKEDDEYKIERNKRQAN